MTARDALDKARVDTVLSRDRASAEGRIDALRKAIDSAVDGLNEAWGGFGPNEQLERVISDLQRARTNDDIAQGRDWPPVVTDALAEAVSDSLAATTEGTDYAEAPEPTDEPGSPYVMRLTNELAARGVVRLSTPRTETSK